MSNTQLIETFIKEVNDIYPELELTVQYVGDCGTGGSSPDTRQWSIQSENKIINAWIWRTNPRHTADKYWHEHTNFNLGQTYMKDCVFVAHVLGGNFTVWYKKLLSFQYAYSTERAALQREGKELKVVESTGKFIVNEL